MQSARAAFLLLLFVLFAPSAWADLNSAFLLLGGRYDNQDDGAEKERIQDRLRLAGDYGFTSKFSMFSDLVTGGNYTTYYSTLKDLKTDSWPQQEINIRLLYLKFQIDESSEVSFGVLPPMPGLTDAVLATSGWIDGLRYQSRKGSWYFGVTAGSFYDLEDVYIWDRERVLNFDAVGLAYFWDFGLVAGISYTGISGENNSELQFKYTPPLFSNWDLAFFAEHQHNYSEDGTSYYFGLSVDLLKPLRGDLADYLTFEFDDMYFDRETGIRAEYADDFYVYGATDKFNLSGKIDPQGHFSWSVNYYANQELPRFNIGINYIYKYSK